MNIDNYIMACHFIGDLPPHRGLFTRGQAFPKGVPAFYGKFQTLFVI